MDVTELLTIVQPVFESLKYSGEPDKDGRKIVKFEAKRDVLTKLDSSVGGLYVVYESKDGEIPHPLYAGKFTGTFTK